MKSLIVETITEIIKDEKAATTIIGAGAAVATGTILEWLPSTVGIAASITTMILSIGLFYFRWKKNKREEEIHEIEMKERRVNLNKEKEN